MAVCGKCGFLTLRNDRTRTLEEAELHFRDRGVSPEDVRDERTTTYEKIPICFKMKRNFADRRVHHALVAALRDEYKCNEFTEWHQGFTPKEHQEILDRNRELSAQRNQNYISLFIAFMGVVVAVFGTYMSARVNLEAAQLQSDAIIRSAQMQIDIQKAIATGQAVVPVSTSTSALPAVMPTATPSAPTRPQVIP